VQLDKPDFVGKPELVWQDRAGSGSVLVGLQPVDPIEVPTEASQIVVRGSTVGRITSSRHSPTLNRGICLAHVPASMAVPGTTVAVRLPDRREIPAVVQEQLAHVDPAGMRLQRGDAPSPTVGADTRPPDNDRPVVSVPVCRSPITLPEPPARSKAMTADSTLTDLSLLAKVHVRGHEHGPLAAALGVVFLHAARDPDGVLVTGSEPGAWTLIGESGTADQIRTRLQALPIQERITVIDLSHSRAMVRLTGSRARTVLSHLCAIDLQDSATPNGTCLRTSVAKVVTDIIRDDHDGRLSYLLHTERASGAYLVGQLQQLVGEHADQPG
jgi:sarcosine oxidase subunit alpha